MRNPTRPLVLLAAALTLCSCTVVKPVACALVFPIHQFGEKLDREDPDEGAADAMPTAGVIAAAPVLIPLNYVYYTLYGAFGGLVSGFVSDLNLITGHGTLRHGRETLFEPMRTNAVR